MRLRSNGYYPANTSIPVCVFFSCLIPNVVQGDARHADPSGQEWVPVLIVTMDDAKKQHVPRSFKDLIQRGASCDRGSHYKPWAKSIKEPTQLDETTGKMISLFT
ncbi:hypothetical protein [uncultured Desulfuromusa sp.]|uniref:hypothetical protein n=1 Tax=uncultured Desulfuromusa sp. TaxID=219183 RepID=UPI002AA6822A|nr:hypothetical protein [uncultured Desulfuromusa sp.]